MKLRKELLARLAYQRRLAEAELAKAKVELAQAEKKLAVARERKINTCTEDIAEKSALETDCLEAEFVRQIREKYCEYWRGQIDAFKVAAFVVENALDTYEECDE